MINTKCDKCKIKAWCWSCDECQNKYFHCFVCSEIMLYVYLSRYRFTHTKERFVEYAKKYNIELKP